MDKKPLILDGAIGTELWAKAETQVPVWRYNIEQPEIVEELCKEYINAGSDLILTNTFGANRPVVSESDYSVEDVIREGIRIAKSVAGKSSKKTVFSIGPLTGLLEPYGLISYDEAAEIYKEMITAGMKEQPDIILFETFMDVEMMKIGVEATKGYDIPVFCTMAFQSVGKTIMGNSPEDLIEATKEFSPAAVGLNCSLTPDEALPIISMFKEATDLPIIFKPNAGKPQMIAGKAIGSVDAEMFAEQTSKAYELGATYIGGCCGTTPLHIKLLKEKFM